MSVFPNQPLFRPSIGRTRLPQDVVDLIQSGHYGDAANTLFLSRFPVFDAYRLLFNCPTVLIPFLHKQSSLVGESAPIQQTICHLYLQTAITALNSMPQADQTAERNRIKIFLTDFTSFLSKKFVLALLHLTGQQTLIAPALLAFKDYESLALRYLISEPQDNQNLRKIIPNLCERSQRQVFLRGLTRDTMSWVEFLDSQALMSLTSVFDGFAALALSLLRTTNSREIRDNTRDLLQGFLDSKRLTVPAHLHIYLITMVLLKETERVQKFLESEYFDLIETDFVANFLVRHEELEIASQIYAKVPDRHILSIKFAAQISLENAIDLLRKKLRDAPDITACWTELLTLAAEHAAHGKAVKWERLVPAAHWNKVTLDEIFQRLPPDLEVTALDRTVAWAVKETSGKIQDSKKIREEIEQRNEEQRQSVAAQIAQPLEIDPAEAQCFFCGQQACDASFVLYPCQHVIHVKCGRNEYPGYDGNVEKLRESCPACGVAALKTLRTVFVDPKKDKDQFARWDVPF